MSDAKVIALDDMRPQQVFAIHISIMRGPYAVPLPGHDAPLGELIWDYCDREAQAAIAACLREAADVIDPTMWEPTELEGVFKSVDARDDAGNDN